MSKDGILDCNIVCDLLPLYHDGVVSDRTNAVVKEHLDNCESCLSEYRALCVELPETEHTSTKNKFSTMMNKLKRKRIFVTILVAILSCALLAGTVAVLTQVPLVDVSDKDIRIERVYRYETDGENKFFILFSSPVFSKITYGNVSISGRPGDEYTLEVNRRTAVLSKVMEDMPRSERVWIIRETDLDDRKIDLDDIEILKFGDKVIWTEAENGDDAVPDYVYAYAEDSILTCTMSVEDNYIGGEYADGRCVIWDLDGNVVYDEYPEESGEYPEYPHYKFPDVNG